MDEEPPATEDGSSSPRIENTTDWETVEKAKPASPPWSSQTKTAVAVGMAVFAGIVLWIARPVLSTFAIAAITAFLVAPMVRFLHRRLKWPRWLALFSGYVVVLVVLVLIVGILTVGISQSIAGFNLGDINESTRGLAEWFVETFRDFKILGFAVDMSQLTQPVEDWLMGSGSVEGGGGFTVDIDQVQSILGGAFNSIRTVAGLIAAVVLSALITFMIAIYLNADSTNLYNWIHRTIPSGYQHDAAFLADRTGRVWRGYIYGQLINSLITGLAVFLVLAFVGLPGAFLMGVIMMIFNMIPTFGPIIAAFPGVIAALVAGSTRFVDMPNWVFALIVAGIYVVVVQAQANIIAPKVMGKAVRLSPVVIMVSLIVGFNVGGLIGSLLAVPIVATIKEYISYLYAKLLDREPFAENGESGNRSSPAADDGAGGARMKKERLPVTDTLRADAVVIGAGLGGLSAAGHLAAEGRRVVVIEHHAVPGGYAHEFKRHGFRFEVALHAMDGVGPGGWMHQPLSDLGVLDRVEFTPLDPFYTTRFPDHEITVWANLNEYLAELKRDFPEEEQGIDDLFAAIERVGHDMGRYTKDRHTGARPDPMEMMERYPDMAMAFASNWASFLDRFISDPRLAAIVSTLWGYLGLPPSKVSAGLFALVILSYHLTGAWYPKGGSQAMSRAMAHAIVERGGEVRYRNTVTHIEVDGDRAVAVETHRGLRVEAEAVISNASPLDTVRLVGREHFDEAFVAGMEADVPALSNLIVYLGVERDLVAEGWDHHEYFLSESYDLETDYRAMVDGDFAHTGMVLAHYTALDPGCAPAGHSVLAMLSLAPWDHENVWGTGGDLSGYQQNEEYLRVKNEAADQLIARAEQLIPGLADSIVVKEIGTPLTNYRYGLNPAGSIYGREQTVANMMNRRSPTTPVPNLFLTGAWVSGGGMSSAIGSGRTAARAAERFLADG